MTDTFHIAVPELAGFTTRMSGAGKIISEELKTAGQTSGLMVQRKAQEYAPKWHGDLSRSITSVSTVTAAGSVTKVGSKLKYAAATEFGRPADAPMPPPGALLPWMASKGIAATELNVKGAKKVRNEKGEIVGSLLTGKDFIGPRRYLPIEYLIARAIKRKAPHPRPFLMKAFTELKPKIQAEFHKVPGRVIARLKALG